MLKKSNSDLLSAIGVPYFTLKYGRFNPELCLNETVYIIQQLYSEINNNRVDNERTAVDDSSTPQSVWYSSLYDRFRSCTKPVQLFKHDIGSSV